MNLGLSFINQIRGGEDTGQLVGDHDTADEGQKTPTPEVNSIGGWIALTFNQLVASIGVGYHREHNTDDTHSTITATGSISERSRTTPMGVWIDANVVDASAFTASGTMTWTVPITAQSNSYMLVGTTMLLNVRLSNTSVGGVLSQFLRMRVPGGFNVARNANTTCLIYDASAGSAAVAQMRALTTSPTIVEFIRADGANLSASASLTSIVGQMQFEVQT